MRGKNWIFISQNTAFFIETAVETLNLATFHCIFLSPAVDCNRFHSEVTKCFIVPASDDVE
jgi:hypothetical protein